MRATPLIYADVTSSALFAHSVFASDLDLAPGEWPGSIPTLMGNGQSFVRGDAIDHHGEFGGFVYRQALGCLSLTVFND